MRYQDATQPIYDEPQYYKLVPDTIGYVGNMLILDMRFVPLPKNPNPEPINMEELLQRGWIRGSDGKWVKVLDIPPHKRVK